MNDKDFIEKIRSIDRKELAIKAGLSYSYLSGIINGFNPLSGKAKKKIEDGLKTKRKSINDTL